MCYYCREKTCIQTRNPPLLSKCHTEFAKHPKSNTQSQYIPTLCSGSSCCPEPSVFRVSRFKGTLISPLCVCMGEGFCRGGVKYLQIPSRKNEKKRKEKEEKFLPKKSNTPLIYTRTLEILI